MGVVPDTLLTPECLDECKPVDELDAVRPYYFVLLHCCMSVLQHRSLRHNQQVFPSLFVRFWRLVTLFLVAPSTTGI